MRSIVEHSRAAALLLPFLLLASCGETRLPTDVILDEPAWSVSALQAGSPNVVISQLYGGGGNSGAPYQNKYVELFNRGATSISLSGWSIQYASSTGTGNFAGNGVVALSGSLAPGQYYLVRLGPTGPTGEPLPVTPDVIGGSSPNPAASQGKLVVVNTTTGLACNGGSTPCSEEQLAQIVDLVGYGNANFFEGSAAAPSLNNTTAAFRRDGGCTDTDDNAADFVTGAPSPRNTASTFNECADVAPAVSGTTPAADAIDVALDESITVTFSKPVDVGEDWFDITCTTSGTHTAAVSGGPMAYTLDPEDDFAGGETCTVTVFADRVADQEDPPNNLAADYEWSFTTIAANVCELPYTATYTIQGSGLATPIAGQTVTTAGVVIGDYQGPAPALRGFYIQDQHGDGDPETSDGLFVFNGNNVSVELGDLVRLTGRAEEFQNQTQLGAVSSIVVCGSGFTIDPVDVFLPIPSATYLERYEGMLVRLPQTLYVTEHFQLGRFGQVVLSSGGRLYQPTNIVLPGGSALAMQAANDLNRIIIDDHLNNQNPDPILFGGGGAPLTAGNTVRGGDVATGIVGVLTYTWAGNAASGNAFRVRPVGALGGVVPDFVPANPRPAVPPAVGGSLKVAAFNLLNYFNTFSGCAGGVGGLPMSCRGARNAFEFDRQTQKTVAAIIALDVDVLGIMEIENDGYGPESAIADLVDRLNAATAPGRYAFLDADAATGEVNALGTDAIKVGLIYRPANVSPVGHTAVLNSVAFVNAGDVAPRNRPTLTQAFAQPNGARFIVNVNHLKSKGSACDVPDAGDGQGNCNLVRTSAANQLRTWLASDPTGTGDPDVLIIGDLNAYALEDPVRALTGSGYTNLISTWLGPQAYSFVFDGQWGNLDHALASTNLVAQVTGVAEWHINADEPNVLGYSTQFKSAGQVVSLYSPDVYRASDHDPVIVGLDLVEPYAFGGFLPPVANQPAVNRALAGQAVPIKFSLSGDHGLGIFDDGYPRSVGVACDSSGGAGTAQATVTAGQSSLSYDAASDTYTYVWSTDRAWSNSCRELEIRFGDSSGNVYRARFNFTR